ncbi:MAG: TolC family protein, partial [Candidatus Omnitrophota bacterium]
RQQLSVFSPDDNQTNEYYARLEKTLPTGTEMSVQISDTRLWSNSTFVSKNPSHDAELSFNVKQPVGRNAFGYADRMNISMTKLAVENAGLDMRDRLEALIAETEKAYLGLVHAKQAKGIYDEMIGKARKLYESDKKNFDIGLIEKVDLLASEANLARLEAEALIVKNNYEISEENLKLVMNMDENTRIIPLAGSGPPPLEMDLQDCLKEAFEKRRDYRKAERDVRLKGIALKVKDNMRWPEIDLTASMAMNGLEGRFAKAAKKITVLDNTCYYAGVEVQVPIENKEAMSEYDKAKYEKEKSLVGVKRTERAIITEVANAFSSVTAFGASRILIRKAVDLHSSKLEEEEKRFSYGRSSTKRIIDYQQDLLRAKLEDARFVLDHNKAKVDMDRVMNVILDKYEDLL